ncbi:MAG: putative Chemotaxis protein methyltransferase [Promethearchaeota archaeon]|nr:MAG: putative Chemotaxis protein methyltransferase [Candidatus Lokiarchaeota archaeon]
MIKRIKLRIAKLQLSNYQEYLEYILNNPVEIDLFLDKFTINYTYFFRNKDIYEELGRYVSSLKKSQKNKLKIWSAPCATGEEPYSIAIYLQEIKKKRPNFPDFRIIASDIDTKALSIAEKGVYGDYSLHAVSEEIKNRYFEKIETKNYTRYALSKKIKEKVEYLNEDIIEGHRKRLKYDIIFCRNFFIYLNRNARDNFIAILEDHLIEGGMLIIGKTETLASQNNDFELIDAKTNFYIKNKDFIDRFLNLPKKKVTPKKDMQKKKVVRDVIKKSATPQNENLKPPKLSRIESKEDYIKIRRKKNKKAKKHEVEQENISIIKKEKIPLSSQKEEKNEKDIVNAIESISPQSNFKSISPKPVKQEHIDFIVPEKEESIEERLPIDEQKKFITEQKEELYLKEQELDEKQRKIEFREKLLEIREKNIKKRIKELNRREKGLHTKMEQLDQLVKPLEKRARELNKREEQLRKREEVIKKFLDKDKPRNSFSLQSDFIGEPNSKNELEIPEGHYSIIDLHNSKRRKKIFSIEELGSGIAIILRDLNNQIFAISHIRYPDPKSVDEILKIEHPHFFIDTSVDLLYKKMVKNGAKDDTINALIIGGAKLRDEEESVSQENIKSIKQELFNLEIPINYQELGGISKRSVKYNVQKNILHIKKIWEQEFRKVKL